MDVYVINLDRHLPRWERICGLLVDDRLKLRRIRALDGARLRDRPDPAAPRPGALPAGRTVLSRFEIACVLSHRQAWRRFLASGASHCVVLEDDVYVGERFADFVCADELERSEFDIIKLETFLPRVAVARSTRPPVLGRRIRRLISYHPGSAGYFLNRSAAQKLLALSRNAPDGADTIIFNIEKYKYFSLRPISIGQVIPGLVIQHQQKPDAPPDPLLDSYVAQHRGERVRRSPLTLAKLRREISRPFRNLWQAISRTAVGFS